MTYDEWVQECAVYEQRIDELEADLAALRQRHAAAVEAAYREGFAQGDIHGSTGAGDPRGAGATWVASEAKQGLEGEHD